MTKETEFNFNTQWQELWMKPMKAYFETMSGQVFDMMMAQWMQRAREENPIKTSQELYDLWLNSCHDIYQKMLKSEPYQKAFNDWMQGMTNLMNANSAK